MSTVSKQDIRRQLADDVADIIIDLMDRGATVRRTKQGHFQIKSSVNRETMGVSRNSGAGFNRMDKVLADARRLYPELSPPQLKLGKGDLRGFDKDCVSVILKAVNELGWTYEWSGSGFIEIKSPKGSKILGFSTGTKPISPNLHALRRIILAHGDVDAPKKFDIEDETEEPEVAAAATESPVEAIHRVHEATQPHVVHQRPWLAKRGTYRSGDRRYESEAVIERQWSDGSLDYVCAVAGCEHPPSTKARSISAHVGAAHSREKGRQGRQDQPSKLILTTEHTEPSYSKPYSPRQSRVAALAERLLKTIRDADSTDLFRAELVETLAREALIWQHEQTGGELSAESEELTAEQILTRIRQMVDGGEYMRQRTQLEELELKHLEMEEKLELANAEAAACRARADGLAGSLEALRELLGGIDTTSEGSTD